MAEAASDYDIIFRNVNDYYRVRLLRKEGGYNHRFVKVEIQQNLLSQGDQSAQKSRPDSGAFYQTSWAGGAQYWKPLLAGDVINTYFQSNHMDTWSEPGKVVPTNQVVDAANTNLHDNCVTAVGPLGVVYAIGFTETTDSGLFDVYVWTPGSDAFVRDTGQNSGVDDDDQPLAMVYDPSDGYFYIITSDPEICRFNPTTNVEDVAWISTGHNAYPGSNIFSTRQALMFYDGDQLYTVNKSAPSVTSVFNDGMGPDFLNESDYAGSAPLYRRNVKLGISTPEGIYYVKNTRQGGQPQAFVYRVDRDAAGNYIGSPIATLPHGSVALSIAEHMGSIVISTSPDWQVIQDNDTLEAEIILYHITQGGMGAIGSPLGGRAALDETPYAILGSQGSLLYLGGHKRLWVWDARGGGLHTAWTWTTELANGPYVAMASVLDSAGVGANIFLGADRIARSKVDRVADPDTVTNFGDDETHYTLESNYFDIGLPMETKTLANLEILFDPSTGTSGSPNQEWTVQLSTDDSAFTDVITSADNNMTTGYARDWISASGRLFRYKLIYQTKTAAKSALRAILATYFTGAQVEEWELLIDATEHLNVNNELIDPDTFVANMSVLANDDNVIALYDNYTTDHIVDQASGSADEKNVKIMSVEIMRTKPGEAIIRMVLREAPEAIA